jgi:hypothetical protein
MKNNKFEFWFGLSIVFIGLAMPFIWFFCDASEPYYWNKYHYVFYIAIHVAVFILVGLDMIEESTK